MPSVPLRLRPTGPARLGLIVAALFGFAFASLPPTTATAAAKPAKKDSSPRIRPKEVRLTASVEPAEARAGETVTYRVTAQLDPGWHIYKYAKVQPDEGPRSTTFDFFDTAGLKVVGDWTASRPPIQKPEPAFNNMVLEYYEDEVDWSIRLQVAAGTAPGKKVLRCQVGYQICDASSCKIPGQWTLPDVVLTVLPSGSTSATAPTGTGGPAETSASAPAPKAPETKPDAPVAPAAQVPAVLPQAPAEPAPAASGARSEIALKAEQGIIPFLLASALGGLIALAMPCVWPMVPITVNFFVKQGHQSKGQTTGLAVTYCLAIIGIFTAVGVLFSFFLSATALQRLANNPWLNVAVAVLFLAFGLSLLGVFEIRLPSFLLNASARGESRGGLIGVVFMALTLTITSFTCTFPVVGGLLVMAAGGQFFLPIVGLATFAAVLALPFFLLALSPGLLSRMPRGGDWMNAVKVVGGLVEIGAACKFINTAEIGFGAVPRRAWMNAQLTLTIWVILATVCGVYLLGLFRTDHDHDEVKVGPVRLLCGSLFLILALYLSPALFGRMPQGPLLNTLVGLFPPDFTELVAPPPPGPGTGLAAGESAGSEATSSDPEEALRQQKSFHGVVWGMSLDAARQRAKAEHRPILIDFTGVNCANCRAMEQGVFPLPEVVAQLSKFVTVQLYTDFVPIASLTQEDREALAAKNQELLLDLAHEATNPIYVALAPDGRVLSTIGGKRGPADFLAFLNEALTKYQDGRKVAQVGPTR